MFNYHYEELQYDPKTGTYFIYDKRNGRITPLTDVKGVTSSISSFFYKGEVLSPSQKELLDEFPLDELKKPSVQNGLLYSGVTQKEIDAYIRLRKALDRGTNIHNEIEKGIAQKTIPTLPEAKKALSNLYTRFPPSQWDYATEVPLSDFRQYASRADIIVTNKQTGEAHIVDIKTGQRKDITAHSAQLSIYKNMYENMYPGKKISGIHVLNTRGKLPAWQEPSLMKKDRLDEVFYGLQILRTPQNADKIGKASLGTKRVLDWGFAPPRSGNFKDMSRSFTVLDTETGGRGEPLSVGAIKLRYNNATKQLELVDVYERYYHALDTSSREYHEALGIHNLSEERITNLRRAQKLKYGRYYDVKEKQALLDFIGQGAVIGQNITGFDLNTLFGMNEIPNDILDTLSVARNAWGRGGNSLSSLYKRITGKEPEDAHDALYDVLMTTDVLKYFLMHDPEALYVINNQGWSYQAADRMITEKDIQSGKEKLPGGLRLIQSVLYHQYQQTQSYGKWKNVDALIREAVETQLGLGGAMPQKIPRAKNIPEGFQPEEENTVDFHENKIDELANAYLSGDVKGLKELSTLGIIEDLRSIAESLKNAYAKEYPVAIIGRSRLKRQIAGDLLKVPEDEREEYMSSAGLYKGEYADTLFMATRLEAYRKEDIRRKQYDKLENKLHRYKEKGLISEEQEGAFDERARRAENKYTFRDISDDIDKAADSTRAWSKALMELSNIPQYNFYRWVQTKEQQGAGILGASRGLVPGVLLSPANRLFAAQTNLWERAWAPHNAARNLWSAIGPTTLGLIGAKVGGTVIGAKLGASLGTAVAPGLGTAVGALGGVALAKLVGGAINAGTQVVGNIGEASIVRRGQYIQHSINSIGFIVDMVAIPFRILAGVTRGLTKTFYTFKNVLTGGIAEMTRMGNPLTNLTGVNMVGYQGSLALDNASLLSQGSMNSTYEDFARQQQEFYSLGHVNTNRLVASSLLGVFSNVYSPSTDTEGQYNGMVNSLIGRMKGQSASEKQRTMALASLIDKNLASLLQTADTLGVSDINELTDPSRRGITWRPLSNEERSSFQWDQYEYRSIKSNIGNSKMRIADTLWRVIGKDFFEGLNSVLDKIAVKGWKSSISDVKAVWDNFIDILKEGKKKLEDMTGWDISWNAVKKGIIGIAEWMVPIVIGIFKKIVDFWDSSVDRIIAKVIPFVALLSTIKVDPVKLLSGKEGGITWALTNRLDATTQYIPKDLSNVLAERNPAAKAFRWWSIDAIMRDIEKNGPIEMNIADKAFSNSILGQSITLRNKEDVEKYINAYQASKEYKSELQKKAAADAWLDVHTDYSDITTPLTKAFHASNSIARTSADYIQGTILSELAKEKKLIIDIQSNGKKAARLGVSNKNIEYDLNSVIAARGTSNTLIIRGSEAN